MDEQENMSEQPKFKANNVFLQSETNETFHQPECTTKETCIQPEFKSNSFPQTECKTLCGTNNEAFLQSDCKTDCVLQSGFETQCGTNECKATFKQLGLDSYKTNSFSHTLCETNETYLQLECETHEQIQHPECKMSEAFQQPKCEMSESSQQLECEMSEASQQVECKMSEASQQPNCEMSESSQQPECEMSEVSQQSECEMSEASQQPECEMSEVSQPPECETNEELKQSDSKIHGEPECETNEALQHECEMNEEFQEECDNEAFLKPECDIDHDMLYDEHGFACVDARNDTIERQHDYPRSSLSESQQHALSKFLDQISGNIDNKSLGKLQSHIRRGIPHHLRGKLWKGVLGTNKLQASSKFNYMLNVQLLRQQMVDLNISEYCSSKLGSDCLDNDNMEFHDKSHVPVTVIRQISVDVDRTFPLHRRFRGNGMEGVEGRASLFRVLAVYARYNPAVGYCQGMSYIVGMLLMNLEEVDAFWVMVVLFEKAKYLSGYFNSSMGRIQRHAEVFKCLLKQRKPLLYRHLENVGVHPLMFITPWFMCLYTSLPCWDTVLSIWDHLIMEGVTVIFRVGLALLDIVEDKIMSTSDMSLILPALLHVPVVYARSDRLLPVLWETTVHRWEIDSMQAIVDEEIEKTKQGRKRALMADETDQKSKRSKTNETEGSLFKRIVNMFTPASQRQQGSSLNNKTQVASKKRKERHRRYPGHVVTRKQAQLKEQDDVASTEKRLSSVTRKQAQLKEQDDVASTEKRLSSVSISPPLDEKRNDGTIHPLKNANKDKQMKVVNGTKHKRGEIRINYNEVEAKASHSKSKDLSPRSSRRGSQGFQFANGVRRSPRISSSDYRSRLGKRSLESWQNPFNTPSNRKLISSSAKVQHAFKMFHTPTPLRNNQGRHLQSSPFFSSPEIEMSSMTAPNQLKDK